MNNVAEKPAADVSGNLPPKTEGMIKMPENAPGLIDVNKSTKPSRLGWLGKAFGVEVVGNNNSDKPKNFAASGGALKTPYTPITVPEQKPENDMFSLDPNKMGEVKPITPNSATGLAEKTSNPFDNIHASQPSEIAANEGSDTSVPAAFQEGLSNTNLDPTVKTENSTEAGGVQASEGIAPPVSAEAKADITAEADGANNNRKNDAVVDSAVPNDSVGEVHAGGPAESSAVSLEGDHHDVNDAVQEPVSEHQIAGVSSASDTLIPPSGPETPVTEIVGEPEIVASEKKPDPVSTMAEDRVEPYSNNDGVVEEQSLYPDQNPGPGTDQPVPDAFHDAFSKSDSGTLDSNVPAANMPVESIESEHPPVEIVAETAAEASKTEVPEVVNAPDIKTQKEEEVSDGVNNSATEEDKTAQEDPIATMVFHGDPGRFVKIEGGKVVINEEELDIAIKEFKEDPKNVLILIKSNPDITAQLQKKGIKLETELAKAA